LGSSRGAGDYRRRTAAGRPLIFVRGGDGQVRVLYNTCTHRGALVCRRDEGNAAGFQCFYHATVRDWSIRLVALPVRLRYPDSESRLPEHRVKRYDLLPRPI